MLTNIISVSGSYCPLFVIYLLSKNNSQNLCFAKILVYLQSEYLQNDNASLLSYAGLQADEVGGKDEK